MYTLDTVFSINTGGLHLDVWGGYYSSVLRYTDKENGNDIDLDVTHDKCQNIKDVINKLRHIVNEFHSLKTMKFGGNYRDGQPTWNNGVQVLVKDLNSNLTYCKAQIIHDGNPNDDCYSSAKKSLSKIMAVLNGLDVNKSKRDFDRGQRDKVYNRLCDNVSSVIKVITPFLPEKTVMRIDKGGVASTIHIETPTISRQFEIHKFFSATDRDEKISSTLRTLCTFFL